MLRRVEEGLQRSVASFLHAIPDLLWWATANQRGTRSRAEMGILKAMGVRAGVPDICIILPGGKIGFLELKAPKGRVSDSQKVFIESAMNKGCSVGVCYSLSDVADHLNSWLGPYGYRIPRVSA